MSINNIKRDIIISQFSLLQSKYVGKKQELDYLVKKDLVAEKSDSIVRLECYNEFIGELAKVFNTISLIEKNVF